MKLMIFISLFVLANCAHKPPDVFAFKSLEQYLVIDPVTGNLFLEPSPACMEAIKEAECGYGVSIVTGQQVYVGEKTLFNKKTWSDLKSQSVYLPAQESYAPLSTYIINACRKANCDSEVNRFIIRFGSQGPK